MSMRTFHDPSGCFFRDAAPAGPRLVRQPVAPGPAPGTRRKDLGVPRLPGQHDRRPRRHHRAHAIGADHRLAAGSELHALLVEELREGFRGAGFQRAGRERTVGLEQADHPQHRERRGGAAQGPGRGVHQRCFSKSRISVSNSSSFDGAGGADGCCASLRFRRLTTFTSRKTANATMVKSRIVWMNLP
jgi:hypothetical protein